MMRDEAFHFTRIGTFLERADSTARILTAHQSDLVPGADAGVVPDPYRLERAAARPVRLRGLSARVSRRHHALQGGAAADPARRHAALAAALLQGGLSNLKSVANEQSAETERRAGEMHAMLHFARMEEITANGLPHFLEQFLAAARSGRSHRIGFLGSPGGGLNYANAHSARNPLPLRAAREIQRAKPAPDAAPRFEPARARLEHHRPGRRLEQVDAYGNISHLLTIEEPHREIRIVVHGVVETATPKAPGRRPLSPLAYLAPTKLTAPNDDSRPSRSDASTWHRAPRPRPGLAEAVFDAVRYKSGTSDVQDSAAVAFKSGEGVCQDHAHVYIASARSLGMPARYVSGYSTPAMPTTPPATPGSMSGWAPKSAGRAWMSPTSAPRCAPTAASPWAATTWMPPRCAACARAAAARKWKPMCWWPSPRSSNSSRLRRHAPTCPTGSFPAMTYCVGFWSTPGS
jgi:hypothetical protein